MGRDEICKKFTCNISLSRVKSMHSFVVLICTTGNYNKLLHYLVNMKLVQSVSKIYTPKINLKLSFYNRNVYNAGRLFVLAVFHHGLTEYAESNILQKC